MSTIHEHRSHGRQQRSLAIAIVAAAGTLAIIWAVCILGFGFWYGLVTGWVPGIACALLVFYLAQISWVWLGVGLASVMGVVTLILSD